MWCTERRSGYWQSKHLVAAKRATQLPSVNDQSPNTHASKPQSQPISPNLITFLLLVFCGALQYWKPEGTATKGLRALVSGLLFFVCGPALLFALFTLWWPLKQWGALLWSGAAVAILAYNFLSSAARDDQD